MSEPGQFDDVPLRPVGPSGSAPYPVPAAQTSGLAITSLVLGITSFLCALILGPLAIIFGIFALRGIKRSGGRLKGDGLAIAGIVLGAVMTFLLTPALLLPAIQAAREAARRNVTMNNMKQISLALVNYADTHRGTYPAASGVDGSQLSWRVHILPYMEENALYEQFHLDEPWDSAHNRTLIDKMPAVFGNPSGGFAKGETSFLAIAGPNTAFGDGTTGPSARDFTDGTSNTVLFVEADRAVPWTKPEDLQFDAKNPTASLGKLHPGGFLAAFADLGVRFIPNTTPPMVIEAMMTPAGGEPMQLQQ